MKTIFLFLRFLLIIHLLSFPNSPVYTADYESLIRVFAGFKNEQGLDYNNDGVINNLDFFALSLNWKSDYTYIQETNPRNGENNVSLTRELILRFSNPLDETTITDQAIYATFAKDRIPGHLHSSKDKRTITLFFKEPLPSSARIRLTVNGSLLKAMPLN